MPSFGEGGEEPFEDEAAAAAGAAAAPTAAAEELGAELEVTNRWRVCRHQNATSGGVLSSPALAAQARQPSGEALTEAQ